MREVSVNSGALLIWQVQERQVITYLVIWLDIVTIIRYITGTSR